MQSVKTSLANLRTFPCVRTLEERGKLHLHAAYFGVATGALSVFDKNVFLMTTPARPPARNTRMKCCKNKKAVSC